MRKRDVLLPNSNWLREGKKTACSVGTLTAVANLPLIFVATKETGSGGGQANQASNQQETEVSHFEV